MATVALTLKIPPKPQLLCFSELSTHFQFAVLTADTVGKVAQMQVNISVWVSAQASAMRATQGLAAELRCHGDVKEVFAKGILDVCFQVGAACLEGNVIKRSSLTRTANRSKLREESVSTA